MASKIHTDNPKHHAYACVNKRERKKVKRVGAKRPLLVLLAYEILRLIQHAPSHFRTRSYSYIPKGHKIIWDDCNHTTYRKMVKVQGSFCLVRTKRHHNSFWGDIKHFKKPYSCDY